MLKAIRILVILATLIGSLWWFNAGISKTNAIRDNGTTILLKLRPVDPRAFMQGDFMALAYDYAAHLVKVPDMDPVGILIFAYDENNVAKFKRIGNIETLSKNEIRIKYALENRRISIGHARYYFQEGTAKIYVGAKYGVFKVSEQGNMVLVGLADKEFVTLSAPN